MVMIEMVYCKITGKTRSLPKVKKAFCMNLFDTFILKRSTISFHSSHGLAKRSKGSGG